MTADSKQPAAPEVIEEKKTVDERDVDDLVRFITGQESKADEAAAKANKKQRKKLKKVCQAYSLHLMLSHWMGS